MSWARIRIGGGILKIKPRWQMRSAERDHRVPVFDLGLIIIAWWSQESLRMFGP